QAFRVVVPNTLLPPGEFQYSVMAGKLRNIPVNYSNLIVGRGLSVHSTVYAGMEYFSDEVTQRNVFPFIRGAFRLTKSVSSDLFFSPLGVAHTAVNIQFPSQLQLGLTFSKYHRDPFINPSGYINTLSISAQGPMMVNSTRVLLGGTGIQTVSSFLRDRTLFLYASVNWLKARVGLEHVFKEENLSRGYETALSTTRINTSILAPAQVVFSAGISFDHLEGQLQSIFLNAQRHIFRNLFFQAQLQRTFRPSITFGQIRLNLSLPYARFITSGIRSEREGGFKSTTFEQLASGSVTASSRTWDVIADYRRQRDRGILLIRPYFDGNDNNLPDGDDQYLPDVKVTTQGRYLTKFTQVIPKGTLVGNVEPYQDYLASIDPQSLGNPYWIPKYNAISITAEPNKLKVINYPILSGGSIGGSVMIIRGDAMLPVVGLTIKIRSVSDSLEYPAEQKARFLKSTKTYSNGMYSFNRLHPGMYEISLDAEELKSLGLRTPILFKQVEIKVLPEGDAVEDINFMLQ
ncbi:MAG TPA: hypothetical protein VFF29_04005, partial [Bacteroidota bacterium]|nr:hypothetical protein [Bacteroidota bacterium]